jgi:transposase
MELSNQQRQELMQLARHGQPAYVRVKALVVLNLGDGQPVTQVARMFRVSRQSVYEWRRRYWEQGASGLRVRAGRGRKSRVDLQQLRDYVRQSPRQFGVALTRWTLASLAQVVPSIKGFSPYGVQKALARAGISYKRGQPSLHSPDPEYAQKKGRWSKL